jgi:hypothetical protein
MDVELNEEDPSKTPAKSFLITAGLPAGLLLWWGSWHILKRVSDSEVYQKEAPETLTLLNLMASVGLAIAVYCGLAILWGMRKLFWRRKS